MKTTLEQLTERWGNAEFTRLARDGKWAEAADLAGRMAVWGVWRMCRTEAGLPATPEAQAELIAAITAAKRAKFNR